MKIIQQIEMQFYIRIKSDMEFDEWVDYHDMRTFLNDVEQGILLNVMRKI